MDAKALQQIFHDLLDALEPMDAKNAALMQLVRDKKLASEEELKSCLESASNASGVRWLATRVRIDHLFAASLKADEEKQESGDKKDSSSQAMPPQQETNSKDPADGKRERDEGHPKEVDESQKSRSHSTDTGAASETDSAPEENQLNTNSKTPEKDADLPMKEKNPPQSK